MVQADIGIAISSYLGICPILGGLCLDDPDPLAAAGLDCLLSGDDGDTVPGTPPPPPRRRPPQPPPGTGPETENSLFYTRTRPPLNQVPALLLCGVCYMARPDACRRRLSLSTTNTLHTHKRGAPFLGSSIAAEEEEACSFFFFLHLSLSAQLFLSSYQHAAAAAAT